MWQKQTDSLYKKIAFKDFNEAFAFMQEVAVVAEELHHHPTWKNSWNKVELWLSTHSAGGVTEKDEVLAARIDDILAEYAPQPTDTEHSKTEPAALVKEVKLFADGGSRGNPGPSASGFVLYDMDGAEIFQKGIYLGVTTNNQAEYLALKFGLEEAKKRNVQQVHVYLDSLLVVNQMIGKFKVKNRDLWPIHESIKELVGSFKKVSFTHVPRELNKAADAEVNKALDEHLDQQQMV